MMIPFMIELHEPVHASAALAPGNSIVIVFFVRLFGNSLAARHTVVQGIDSR